MLTKMRKNILFTLGVLVVMSSCVNKDYDLTRPIDKTMNVGGLIEMPVPGESSYSYTLEEILMPKDASDGSGLLKKRDDGTFVLEVEPTAGLNENYTFAGIEADNYTKTVEYPENDYFYAPGPGVTWPEETSPVDTKVPLNLKISGIDSRVEAIREVELDAALNLSVVAPPEVHLSILKDFRFTLPENMYVDETRLQSFMRLERHNVIVITTDLTSSNSFSSTCYISKIDMSGLALENAAGKTDKEINFSDNLTVAGKVKFTDVGLPSGEKFRINTRLSITDITAKTVTFKASPVIDCEPQEVPIDNVPDALTDGSLSFELDDALFYVTAKNSTPFDLTLSADITAYSKDGQQTGHVSISNSDGVTVGANTESQKFCLSDSGKYGDVSDKKIKVPGLAGIVSPIPAKIAISETKISGSAGGDGYVTVQAGSNYPVGLTYRIEVPLSFKSLTLKRDENIDINVDFGNDIRFDDIFIKANFTSTLPMDASITFDLVDSEGKAMQGVSLKYEDESGNEIEALRLPAGELSTPSTRMLKLVAVADKGTHISKLQSLRLHIVASSPENSVVTLNAKQSLSVSDIVVGTNSGVFIDGNKQPDENL